MNKTLNGIQALRAIAAYAVVLYHVLEGLNATNPTVFPRFVLGQAGVDLFFVISGFVMVFITRGEDETPVGFISKRIARIVPLYWVATLFTIIGAILIPWGFPAVNLSPESIASSLFFIPHPNTVGTPVPVLVVGWTLNFEMMFYVLFTVAMFASRGWRVPIVIALIIGGDMLARSLNGPAADFYGLLISFEFAFGCLLAAIVQTSAVRAVIRTIPMWPLGLAAVLCFVLAPQLTSFSPWRMVYYGLPSALLLFAIVGQDLHRTPIPRTWLNHFGDASYSAYLLHGFVIIAVVGVVHRTIGYDALGGAVVIVASLVGTAIVSAASFMWLERPSNRWLRRVLRLDPPRPKAPAPPVEESGVQPNARRHFPTAPR